MSTVTNTTTNVADVYALFDMLSNGRYAALTREPRERFRSGLCCLKLVIAIPEGYRIGTNYSGEALLVSLDDNEAKNLRIAYNFCNGCIESVFPGVGGEPIKGCHIISREEI